MYDLCIFHYYSVICPLNTNTLIPKTIKDSPFINQHMKRLILSLISIFSIVFASHAVTYTVTNNGDTGGGTLRQALQDAAGAAGGPHIINFSTAMVITISSDLSIDAGNHVGLTINGFVDAVAGPDVTILGNGILNNKLFLNNASGVKINGLVFDNLDYGIQMNNSTNCQVKGCYFGSNLAGSAAAAGIKHAGVFINSGGSGNIIGGINTISSGGVNNPERCIFVKCMQVVVGSDQVRYGAVLIDGSGTNQVVNNYFGTDITGTIKLGNGTQATKMPLDHHNILIRNAAASTNVVDRNLIAGATGCGIYIEGGAAGTIIKGNIIGLNAGTSAKLSNEACGIYMESSNNAIIGGSTALERNIISGNGGAAHNSYDDVCHYAWNDFNQYGIYAKNINGCVFKGNYIGTDASGNSSGAANILGNRAGGIKIVTQEDGGGSSNNIIGGTNSGEGNVISGNGYNVGASIPNNTCNSGNPSLSGITGGPGITLQYGTCSFNTILGNNIGLGADGTTALGNSQEGISILGASSNTIGGNTPAASNYIANNSWGIMMQVDFACHYSDAIKDCVNTLTKVSKDNIVIGNSIGVDRAGNAKGNGNRSGDSEGGGICLQMGSSGNYIGRNNAGEGNVIAGNRAGLVFRDADDGKYGKGAAKNNFVYNNIIGDPTGTGTLGNTLSPAQTIYGHGILMQIGTIGTTFPSGNIIGGTGTNEKNYISGNQQSGILLYHTAAITVATANSIIGNYIGTNVAGNANAGNARQGIEIVNVSRTTISSNVISGNTQNGISLTGSSTNTIQNNTIGAAVDKTAPIPNGANGIFLSASLSNTIQGNTIARNTSNGISLTAASANNIIGGVSAASPNTLANTINNNGANGVLVDGATSINNSIHQNSFSCNTLRGIVLANGGNANFKTATIVGSPTQLVYTNPNTTAARIEIFETDGCATCQAAPTRLQGKTFVRSANIAAGGTYAFTNALGFTSTKLYTVILHEGANITTTAARNTSEFSSCYTLCQDGATVTITGTPLTFCEGGSVTLTANVTGGTGTPSYVWTRGGVAISGATASTYVASVSGSYSVDYNSTTSCGITSPASPTVVTVNPRPTITSSATGTACSGDAKPYTITSSVASGFTWSRAAVAGITPATGSGATAAINEVLTNSTTSAINVVYTINASSTTGSCTLVLPFTYTVTVNPAATVPDQTPAPICSGSSFSVAPTGVPSGTTYTWTAPVVTGSVSGASAQSTAQTSISQTLTNNGITAATVVYTVTPTSGTCPGSTFKVTVTVNPKATVTDQTPAAICSGSSFSVTPAGVPSGTTYTWTAPVITGSVSGASAQSAQTSISQTLTNNGTEAATVVYTVTPTSGTCSGSSFKVTVTVNPKATVPDQTPAPICSGSSFSVTPADVPSGTMYTWTAPVVTGSVSGASAQSTAQASISQTLTNNGTAAATVVYTVTPTSGTCPGSSFKITVTVNANSTVTTANTADVCSGETTGINLTSSPASAAFTWVVGTVTDVSGASDGSGSSIAQTLSASTANAGTVEYIVTPSLGGCTGDSKIITVTVNPKPVAAITPSKPTAICSTDSVDLAATATGFTGGTFTWYKQAINYGNENPLRVKEEGIFHVIYTSSTNCSSLPSASITVSFNPNNSEASAYDTSLTTCLDHLVLGARKPEYGSGLWTIYAPSPTNASLVAGTSLDSVTVIDLEDGLDYKFLYTVSGACGDDKTDTVFVSVGIDDFDLTASGPTDTLCVKTNRELTATVIGNGGSGSYSYVWGGSDGFALVTTSSTITVNPTQATTTYVVFVNDLVNIGCKAMLMGDIEVQSVESQNLDIPNLITPNGDNMNDLFILRDKNEVNGTRVPFISEGSHLEIVNRWGSKVFEANNYKNDWGAKELTDGIYYYHITSSCGNKEYKSWIQILGNTNN